MKRFWKVLSLFLALVLVLTPVAPVAAEEIVPAQGKDLSGYTVILHTNDTHGRIVPDSYSGIMGFTAVRALKKEIQAAGAQVILLDAGDTLHGLPIATVSSGASIVDVMNLVGYDAMTPGNHDFNYGSDRLVELSKSMKFPLVSANVIVKNSGSELLTDNILIEKNGVKYGIFGLTTPEVEYKTNPKNVSTLKFADPVAIAESQVAELKAAGATFIIALAHLGLDKASDVTSELVAEKVKGINLIVDGHSHSVLEEGKLVNDTLIVSAGEWDKNIGVTVIDKDGKVSAGLFNATEFTGKDESVDMFIGKISQEQKSILSEVVGHTNVVLDGVRENVRAKESNLGNLVTDAFRKATGADVAFTNGGGIRASIAVGDITKGHLTTVFPFGNYVVTKKVTGEALLKALEHGVSKYPEANGGFPQVSGVTFQIDASKPAGSRVVNAKINGKDIVAKNKYLLASNDFTMAGGDGYTMFSEFPIENEFAAMEEILINYIKDLGDINIATEDRITVLPAGAVEEVAEEVVEEVVVEEEVEVVADEEIEEEVEEEVEEVVEEAKVVIYVVKKGDFLSKIAKELLGKESEWKKIYEWNKATIANPDRIYIGQKLEILPQ